MRGIRAEFLKLRTTRTLLWLALSMLGLIVLAVLLHGVGLPLNDVAQQSTQMRVFISGQNLGSVFAALAGAVAITSEFRHGTIRPTFMAQPERSAVVRAKAAAIALVGALVGAVATAVAGGLAIACLHARDVTVLLDHTDLVQGILGGSVAAALWAVIGLGIGGLMRNQVGAIIGLFIWVQVIENLLIDSVPSFSSYMPGALAQAIAGSQQGTVDSAVIAALLLAVYAAAIGSACTLRIARTDVA